MFFDNQQLASRKRARLAVPPPVPDTGWRPPQYLPELRTASVISFDVETYEEDFDKSGPGWARGKGHIVGVAIAAMWPNGERGKWYFPVRHHIEKEWNLNPTKVFAWLKVMLETDIPKIGANLIYDIGWLTEENIFVKGQLHDVQFAEALIDEDALVALDTLADKYLGASKTTSDLYDWLARAYGGKPTGAQRANIYKAPARLVGPYGEDDADLPINILWAQWPILQQQNLVNLFKMECNLIVLLIKMRRQGVKIDMHQAEKMYADIGVKVKQMYEDLYQKTGLRVNVNSGDDLARLFKATGIVS